MLRQKLKGARVSKELDFGLIGDMTESLSGSDLNRICQEAKRILFRKMVDAKVGNKGNKVAENLEIDQEDIKVAIARTCPNRISLQRQSEN